MAKNGIAAVRRTIERVASDVLGIPVKLEGGVFRLEGYESERGRIHHLSIDIDWDEISIHSKFACCVQPDLPDGYPLNPYSGRWDQSLPRLGTDSATLEAWLRLILAELRPNGATRADRPCIWEDYYIPNWHALMARRRD